MANLNRSQFPLHDPQGLLDPEPLYHGTSQAIEGGTILPPRVHGKESHWGGQNYVSPAGERARDYAYVHPDEETAWEFAAQRSSMDDWDPDNPPARPRVYETHHAADESEGHDVYGEIKSPSGFDIKRSVDIIPGRQGTFPQINWHQFAQARGGSDGHVEDAPSPFASNHPHDLAIKYGHEIAQRGMGFEHDLPRQQTRKAEALNSRETNIVAQDWAHLDEPPTNKVDWRKATGPWEQEGLF